VGFIHVTLPLEKCMATKSEVVVALGLRNVRRAQKNTNNEIMEVICDKCTCDECVANGFATSCISCGIRCFDKVESFWGSYFFATPRRHC